MDNGYFYYGRFRVMFLLPFFGNVPDLKHIFRYVSFLLAALSVKPFKLFEALILRNKISQHNLEKDPIFILGHMRSGTTHLHNLLSLDSNYSYPSTFGAYAPEFFMYSKKILLPLLKIVVPTKRPMDNMEISIDLPQEEEFAIASISKHSFFFHMMFPRNSEKYFTKYTLFQAINTNEYKSWKNRYMWVVKKFSYAGNGKQLILKNPVNTSRTKALQELFPNAKFIHIYRNPYDVYISTRNLYHKVHPLCRLQSVDWDYIDNMILDFYCRQMSAYFKNMESINPANLIEVRYEDLENNTIYELKRIYQKLNMGEFEPVSDIFQHYILSQKSYKKNSFTISDETRKKINEKCAAIFAKLNYEIIN